MFDNNNTCNFFFFKIKFVLVGEGTLAMSAEQSGYAAGLDFPYAGALLRVGAMAALHPVDYAKTLIQIGHEPLAPAQTKTLITQKPALALPSVFRWVMLRLACFVLQFLYL